MKHVDSFYYVAGNLKLGKPPCGDGESPKFGYMTMHDIMGGLMHVPVVAASIKRTAHNEITYGFSGTTFVRYRDTDIVTLFTNGRLEIDTGGWNTPSTRRHILAALHRLGFDGACLSGEKAIRGIQISIPDFMEGRGVFFRKRGVLKKEAGGIFESDLGYVQTPRHDGGTILDYGASRDTVEV